MWAFGRMSVTCVRNLKCIIQSVMIIGRSLYEFENTALLEKVLVAVGVKPLIDDAS